MTTFAKKLLKGSKEIDRKKQEIHTLLSILGSEAFNARSARKLTSEEGVASFMVGNIPHSWKIIPAANGTIFKVNHYLSDDTEVGVFSTYVPDRLPLNAKTTVEIHSGLEWLVRGMMDRFDLKYALQPLLDAAA